MILDNHGMLVLYGKNVAKIFQENSLKWRKIDAATPITL